MIGSLTNFAIANENVESAVNWGDCGPSSSYRTPIRYPRWGAGVDTREILRFAQE